MCVCLLTEQTSITIEGTSDDLNNLNNISLPKKRQKSWKFTEINLQRMHSDNDPQKNTMVETGEDLDR